MNTFLRIAYISFFFGVVACVLALFSSCGTRVCYTHPKTGITICETIDGKLNPEIDLQSAANAIANKSDSIEGLKIVPVK